MTVLYILIKKKECQNFKHLKNCLEEYDNIMEMETIKTL